MGFEGCIYSTILLLYLPAGGSDLSYAPQSTRFAIVAAMSSNATVTVTDTYFWRVTDGLPDDGLVLDMVLGIILSVFTGMSSASPTRNSGRSHPESFLQWF